MNIEPIKGMVKMLLSRIAVYCVLGVLLAVSNLANASPIVWTLENVVFASDNATASGTFTVDSVTGSLLAIDILTTQGNEPPAFGTFPAGTYDTLSDVTIFDPTAGLLYGDSGSGLELDFSSPLASGGPINVGGFEAAMVNGSPNYRNISSGYVIADSPSTVPLPASLPLMLTGLVLLALVKKSMKYGAGGGFPVNLPAG